MVREMAAAFLYLTLVAGTVVAGSAEKTPVGAVGNVTLGPRPLLVALSVRDIAASTKWYVETLGFRVLYPPVGRTKPLRSVLELNGFFLSLISVEDPAEREGALPNPLDPASLTGIYRFGIAVPDLDAALQPLRHQGGLLRTQVDGGWGIRWCELNDPDGNKVWLIQQLWRPQEPRPPR